MSPRETARAYAIEHQVCMPWGPCDDCDAPRDDTGANGWRSYMVTDEVWASAGAVEYGCLLCMPCLERRIGRRLVASDFLDLPTNEWLRCPEVAR